MVSNAIQKNQLEYRPVTTDLWDEFETLFEEFDRFKGCWCMWWRIKRAEFNQQFGKGNKQAMKEIVEAGNVPGLLAFHDGQPIAWCSVGPREDYPVINRSPNLKRVDDQPVWSVVCFFIAKPYRGQGMTEELIKAAVDHARQNGATIVEAYPVIPEESKDPSYQTFTGVVTTFHKLGFKEVVRRSKIRPIMRYFLQELKESEISQR
jgi:GNAT superfamily N-acetyltransferase